MSVGRSVYDRLKQAGKGKDFETIKRRWAFERFLARIATRAGEDGWVLKGGVLMISLDLSDTRATLDIDFSIRQDARDGINVLDALTDACAALPPEEDGMEFAVDRSAVRVIREFADQPTVRAYIDCVLRCGGEGYKDMAIRFMVDVTRAELSHDIAICAFPPLLKSFGPTPIPSYPWSLVAAEKLHAIMTGTIRNPRLRDYMDMLALSRSGVIDPGTLSQEISEVFRVRGDEIHADAVGLSRDFASHRQADWKGTLKRTGYAGRLPEQFTSAMTEIVDWASPILSMAKLSSSPENTP